MWYKRLPKRAGRSPAGIPPRGAGPLRAQGGSGPRARPRPAKALVTHSFADKVFFCNSGAEANEAAVKLARKAARLAGPGDRYEIITTAGSFHGRTLAMISASGPPKLPAGYEPLLPGVVSRP